MSGKNINKKLLLCAIILLALVFRFNALSHGLENTPVPSFDSESILINTALRMLENGNFDVSVGGNGYQPVLVYINAVAYAVIFSFKMLFGVFVNMKEIKESLIVDRSEIVLISRIIVACLSTASVYALYVAGKKMFGEAVGLIAAFLFSVELMHITTSHIATVWAPMLLFLILAFSEAIDVYKIGSCRAYFLSALFASLAFGTHLVGGIAIIPLIVAHFLRQDKIVSKKTFLSGKFLWVMLVFLVFICFFTILNPLPLFGELKNNYIMEETGFQTVFTNDYEFFYYAFEFIFEYHPLLSILVFFGIVILIFEKKYRELVLILFLPLLYYLYIGIMTFSYQARFFIIFMPFALLLAAYFIFESVKFLKIKNQTAFKIILFASVIIAALPSIYIVSRWSLIVRNRSTNMQFQEWVYRNIPANSKILINHMDGQFFLAQNREYLEFYNNTFGRDNLTERQKFLLDDLLRNYDYIAYFPLVANLVPKENWEQILKKYKFDYYVEMYQEDKPPVIHELIPVIKGMELVEHFAPDFESKTLQESIITSLYRPYKVLAKIKKNYGSEINIYKLKKK